MPNNKVQQNKKSDSSPISTSVEITLPATIHIELVQGNELRHYEIFFSLASAALSTAVGFWTAYITTGTDSNVLFWSAWAFTGLIVLSGGFALYYRRKMNGGKIKKVASLDKFE